MFFFFILSIRPAEISKEIYPEINTLHSVTSKNVNSQSTDTNHMIQSDMNISNEFDAAVGNIINIIVSYDMGWSTRGNGRSYDSLNGYDAVIGFLSGKIIDFATRNRKCAFCDYGNNKENHDCRKNFEGSAKAMEPSVGVELMTQSTVLKEIGLNARVLIGDEDSSTIAAVRRESLQSIFKLCDSNHLKKNFLSNLYQLKKQFKEMAKKDTIPYLKKCFSYAVAQNRGKSSELANILRSIPEHVFGRHENCGNWCGNYRNTRNNKPQEVLLTDPKLYNKLREIFFKYAANASKFSIAASSQANESLNNIMAHKAPKNKCYSRSASSDYRFASAVCNKNEGDSHIINIKEKLCLSPGRYTKSFVAKKDEIRAKRAVIARLPVTKKQSKKCATQK
ncbi:uncharacterized protein [Linepithema humile]|uniref:uncharacterized protein n=1 Tax=Linepithema humile TaxID=83485 RepID=UPI00351DD08D